MTAFHLERVFGCQWPENKLDNLTALSGVHRIAGGMVYAGEESQSAFQGMIFFKRYQV
jgi:hypothetical protein